MHAGESVRLTIRIEGRSIELVLPDATNIEVDLSNVEAAKVRTTDAMPARVRRLYHKLLTDAQVSGASLVFVDVVAYCEALGTTAATLGKGMAALERHGVIRKDRKRLRTGRVSSYQVELIGKLEAQAAAPLVEADGTGLWNVALRQIASNISHDARHVFIALCKLADIDGYLMASQSAIVGQLEVSADIGLSSIIDRLEDEEWISVQEHQDLLCATICNYSGLRGGGMPLDAWTVENAECD